MTTKAELEQRLTDAQSECIEWVLRHDAVEAENAELRQSLEDNDLILDEAKRHLAEMPAMLDRQDALFAKASAALGQAKRQITWTAALAFIAGIALASLVAGVW